MSVIRAPEAVIGAVTKDLCLRYMFCRLSHHILLCQPYHPDPNTGSDARYMADAYGIPAEATFSARIMRSVDQGVEMRLSFVAIRCLLTKELS